LHTLFWTITEFSTLGEKKIIKIKLKTDRDFYQATTGLYFGILFCSAKVILFYVDAWLGYDLNPK